MSFIKILIVEDNILHQEQLYLELRDTSYKIVGVISESIDVIPAVIKSRPDVILMDIDLGEGKSGIELAREIMNIKPTPIIYTTGRTDLSSIQDAISTLPVSYLTKPINKDNLLPAIELALFKLANHESAEKNVDNVINPTSVFIKCKDELLKINLIDICAIVVEKDRYLKIITDNDSYLIRSSIKEMLEKLPDFFVQTHRSTVVNIHKLMSINEFESTVNVNHKSYYLGQTFKSNIFEKIKTM